MVKISLSAGAGTTLVPFDSWYDALSTTQHCFLVSSWNGDGYAEKQEEKTEMVVVIISYINGSFYTKNIEVEF